MTPASTNQGSNQPASPTRFGRRELMLAAGASFAGVGIPASVLASFWRNQDAEPAIAILGSGRRLGLYVTDGPARFLLSIGADGQALLNALASARSIASRRIDIALLAGTSSDLPAHSVTDLDLEVRTLLLLDNGSGIGRQLTRSLDGRLTSSRRIRLGDRLTLTVEIGRPVDGEMQPWRIVIDASGSRVVYLPNMSDVERLPALPPVAAAIAGPKSLDAALSLSPRLVCVPDEIERFEVEDAALEQGASPGWLCRIAAHDSARLRLAPGGLELPAGAETLATSTPPGATPSP